MDTATPRWAALKLAMIISVLAYAHLFFSMTHTEDGVQGRVVAYGWHPELLSVLYRQALTPALVGVALSTALMFTLKKGEQQERQFLMWLAVGLGVAGLLLPIVYNVTVAANEMMFKQVFGGDMVTWMTHWWPVKSHPFLPSSMVNEDDVVQPIVEEGI